MPYLDPDCEGALEATTIRLFEDLGWKTANLFHEQFGQGPAFERETMEQVVLEHRLRRALERLNQGLSPLAIELAIDELSKQRRTLSPVRANQEIHRLLRDGFLAKVRNVEGEEEVDTVKVVDWERPENNEFFLASQFWVSGDLGKKRADLVGFVNGLPLVFIELKASHVALETAYRKNLSDYKDTIPQILWYNAMVVLSNGSDSRLGSVSAGWEHFTDWKRISDEAESGAISLETMVRGVCHKARLLDLVESFTLFSEDKGGTIKLVAKNHQFLGVNNAIDAVRQIQENQGRLGVFWHTQGSGKSFSMVFFSQKVMRKLHGNWTFLIVTDREDLDGQIYRNFASTGAVTEEESRVRAQSAEHLKQMLNAEDHRYVFTLIQKFRTEDGSAYPKLSDRKDIIVITDEAHRSQYDVFALNMRSALPNAAFIGFTGTPLMAGEERTRQVFGDYISVYNFKQSIDDGNTVPLYYENRIPELQLTNATLSEDMAEIIDNAGLDEDQEARLEREFAKEYHLITREDRLERIAEDIVSHYMGRGFLAKAMVISIDKTTAVRTYDKVRAHWQGAIQRLRSEVEAVGEEPERKELQARLEFMEKTDMAVVVSQSQNEVEEFRRKGLDMATHRKRMVKEDLETKFKNPEDPLRVVFVCAMWITGFDVPSCSTIYLDKPMKNHTLMQTIARANRVWRDKQNGLIVDYVGIFRNLQRALAIYGSTLGNEGPEDRPIKEKAALVEELRGAISRGKAFCWKHGAEVEPIVDAAGFQRVKLLDDAVEALVANDDTRRQYLLLAGGVAKLHKSLLPDAAAVEFGMVCKVFKVLAEKIRLTLPPADISGVMGDVEQLLDGSIEAGGYVIRGTGGRIDLSQIDFDALRQEFEGGRKATAAQRLRSQVARILTEMIRMNRTRMNYQEEFQQMIDEYNAGAANVEDFFAKLMAFTRRLTEEQKRGIAENLSEEELVIFDLLTKPDVKLTKAEEIQVKKVAQDLLAKLKTEKLVLDWKQTQTTRASVRYTIETVLDSLPRVYSTEMFESKCDAVYQHVFESYGGLGMTLP